MATKAGLLEMSGVYQLSVTASDSSSPARSSVATVIVDIEDFNNHSPVLRVDGDIDTTVNRPEVCVSLTWFSDSCVSMTAVSTLTLDFTYLELTRRHCSHRDSS